MEKLTYCITLDGIHLHDVEAKIENGTIIIPDPPPSLLPPEERIHDRMNRRPMMLAMSAAG